MAKKISEMNMQITNPKSQQERVIAVCSDGQYRTLEAIQHEIKQRLISLIQHQL